MAKKQSSPELSSLASQVLKGHKPTRSEITRLAASVLSQDEERGQAPEAPGEPITGDTFLTTLTAAIAPETIVSMKNNTVDRDGGIDFTLSDGRKFTAKRQTIKAATTQDELNAYVQALIG